MNPTVFVDRDGVINVDRCYVFRIEAFEFVVGIFEALTCITRAGYQTIVVTNQSAIGRGFCTEHDFEQLNAWMLQTLTARGAKITAVYHCPHHPEEQCACRKPAPGMFLQAIKDHHIDTARSWVIGDRETDIDAANHAGIKHTIRLCGKGSEFPHPTKASFLCNSILEAAAIVPSMTGTT